MSASSIELPAAADELRFFRRPVSALESRFAAIAAAVGTVALAGMVLGMWPYAPRLGFILLTAIMPFAALKFISKPSIAQGVSVFLFYVMVAALWDLGPRLLLAGGALLVALLFTWMEQRRGLRRAALLGALRDLLWRSLGTIAAAIAALAAANRTERAVFEAAYNTPLEGLALWAGVFAGGALALVLVAAVWLLPRIAAKRMRSGLALPAASADALWLGVFLSGVAIALDVRDGVALGIFSDAFGRMAWLALAATFAFAAARLGLSATVTPDIQQLWIVIPGAQETPRLLRRHAAALAARWRNGPVTVVAAPETAIRLGGAHLRLAQLRGEVEMLFPRKAIHLADWNDTLPPPGRWKALPIRELYVDAALWPELFESRLQPNALIVVIAEKETGVVDELRAILPTNRTDFHLPPGAGVELERWPGAEVYPILGAGDASIDSWILRNGLARDRAAGPRAVLIGYAAQSRDLAEKLRAALAGAVDGGGRKVLAGTALVTPNRFTLSRLPSNYWYTGLGLKQIRDDSAGRWWGPLTQPLIDGIVGKADFEFLVIEGAPDVVTVANVLKTVNLRLLRSLTRVIGVLPPDQTAPRLSMYNALLHRPAGNLDVQAADIARRYLALDFEPPMEPDPVPAAKVMPTLRERLPPRTGRRRVYLAKVAAQYTALDKRVRARLSRSFDIVESVAPVSGLMQEQGWLAQFKIMSVQESRAEIARTLAGADAVVAIVETLPAFGAPGELELAVAASLNKPIFAIVTVALPAPLKAAPTHGGAVYYLTNPSDERVFEKIVARLSIALERLVT